METLGLHKHRIAYSAIPRCANTSLKLALFELQTGREFKQYLGDGHLWPHSTPKLEIHRNDIEEFDSLSEDEIEVIESNYEFWFTIIGNPLRRLFSAYQMLILLEDPHLQVMFGESGKFRSLDNVSFQSISSHFEEFLKSDLFNLLIEEDVHFIPQSKMLGKFISSSKLRIYGLGQVNKLESDLNYFLSRSSIKRSIRIPRCNVSYLSLNDLEISSECLRIAHTVYDQDFQLIENKQEILENSTIVSNCLKDESLLNIIVNETRERNRSILLLFQRHKEILNRFEQSMKRGEKS